MLPKFLPQDDTVTRLWLPFCNGDMEAFALIAEESYKSLYHYGTKFTGDKELVKDCLQDLFLDLWEKRMQCSHIVRPRSYLFQAFRNNLLHSSRKQARFTIFDHDDDKHTSAFVEEADWIVKEAEDHVNGRLRQIIKLLPKRQGEALYLRYYENLSYEEIAQVMGLRRQAVANYLQYGIQKLREYWNQSVVSILLLILS